MAKTSAEQAPRPPGERIRLLVVTHSLTTGGAERFASNLAAALDRRRFAPSLCLVTGRATYPLPDDVPASTLGYRGLHHLPRTLLRLRRLIAAERPDVVLSNVLATNCLTGGALSGLPDPPPWIARIGLAPELGEPFHQRLWARRCYPLARAVVSNSERMLASFVRSYPQTRGRCRSLPNPTDFECLDRRAAEPPSREARGEATLLAVGRLTRQKRPDVLLQALARVRRSVAARLWLCGDGPLRGRVRRWIGELGLEGAVEILGFCDNPFALMRQADLFVLSSDYEGLPNALIEAQGLGLPAVATRCPYGPDEIVEDGVTGRLADPGDAAGLARAIVDLLGDAEARRRMAAAAARRARERYDTARVVPRWEDLLAEVAG